MGTRMCSLNVLSRRRKLACIARDLHGSCNERALGIGHNLALELGSICTLGIWKLLTLTAMLLSYSHLRAISNDHWQQLHLQC